jgi:hypothetical protein
VKIYRVLFFFNSPTPAGPPVINYFQIFRVWKLPDSEKGSSQLQLKFTLLYPLYLHRGLPLTLCMQGTCSLKCLSASANSGSGALSCHFHRLTAICCLHDCIISHAVGVRVADGVCIATYENCTHVCNFLGKVKVKFTL